MGDWSFLTNHAQALLCIAVNPDVRLRAIGDAIGVQERAAHALVCDLIEGGYLTKRRVGRRNVYEIHRDVPLRRPLYGEQTVGALLDLLLPPAPPSDSPTSRTTPAPGGKEAGRTSSPAADAGRASAPRKKATTRTTRAAR